MTDKIKALLKPYFFEQDGEVWSNDRVRGYNACLSEVIEIIKRFD